MAKLQFITDVSNVGLLQSLARTRARLVLSTLAAIGATYGLGFWSAHYIFEVSNSVVGNMFIITANMFALLIASFLLTALIGDVAFPGPWRETVFLESDPGDRDRAPVNNHSGEFFAILVLAILGNAFGLNYATGGFLERYHSVGYFKVRLRADKPAGRIEAYEQLTRDTNFPLWSDGDVQQLVLDGFEDSDGSVRAMAIWSAGKMEIDRARDRIVQMLDDPSPTVGAAAAVTLGKLTRSVRTRKAVEATLESAQSDERRIGALRGLGLMRSERSTDVIVPLLDAENERVVIHAFWALRRIGSESVRPTIRKIIDDGPPKLRLCAAFDTLKKVATEEDVLWAKRQYQSGEFPPPCEGRRWTERDGTVRRILIGDSFRVKLLKVVANEAAPAHRGWFQRIVNDPRAKDRHREVASDVLRQLDRVQ